MAQLYHKIPFYVAAPKSTFDLKIKSGQEIAIEMRDSNEVSMIMHKRTAAPSGVKILNPAFDVTGHELISGIITDKGLIQPPYKKNIAGILGK